MSDIIIQISKIKKDIKKFYTYDYLYEDFDTLVKSLETQGINSLSDNENIELKDLIHILAADSRYNNYASANWMRYSARCFYCADYLVKYIREHERCALENFLNIYFNELVEQGVVPIIPYETLCKYIQTNIDSANAKELYGMLVKKSIGECGRCRYWQANDAALANSYTNSMSTIIHDYINKFSDLSVLKEWLPNIGTVRLAKIWYEYPDSGNYRHSGEWTRKSVEKSLDEMLDIHLELFSYWYQHNPQELIDTLPMEDIIEILEVSEDGDFEKILRHAVTLPWNEKVEGVLKHFLDDDEQWIVNLSQRLLITYGKDVFHH